jgi:aryl-alcohol dehydrogenase-like predicted oxidoreductase
MGAPADVSWDRFPVDPLDARAAVGGGGFGGIGSPRALIGMGLDEQASRTVLDRCVDLGVTIIDTAYGYAAGESQRILGRWLVGEPRRRAGVAIVDKVGVVERGGEPAIDLSPSNVVRSAAEGRARMGVSTVEVIMSHGPDPDTPVEDSLGAFAELIEQGAARHWGVSNVDADGLAAWITAAEVRGLPGPRLVENELSLLARQDEAEVLPLCREQGITYLAYSPLAGGVLSGRYRRGEAVPAGSRLALRPDSAAVLTLDVHDRIDALAMLAASMGVSLAGLALAWVMAQPGVRPIVGVRTPEHLEALAEALSLRFTDDQVAEISVN